jgi:redox-sensing transcriptional repressor
MAGKDQQDAHKEPTAEGMPPLADSKLASGLSASLVERLYNYYLLANRAKSQGQSHISSRQLAEFLQVGDTQVRKDMAAINMVGQPKRGYEIDATIASLRRTMGLDQVHRAVLCGVGRLGRALLMYSRFTEFGFHMVGAFDVREEVIGEDVAGTSVLHIDRLTEVIDIFSVEIGILTVDVWAAQEICDRMVASGVKAIWNFAPIHLRVPQHVLVRHEDFAGSLSVISHHLRSNHYPSGDNPPPVLA